MIDDGVLGMMYLIYMASILQVNGMCKKNIYLIAINLFS